MFITSNKKSRNRKKLIFILFPFLTIVLIIIGYNYNKLHRYIYNIQLSSYSVRFLDNKVKFYDIIKFDKTVDRRQINITMSPSDFVLLQKERARMVTNYILTGGLWQGHNTKYNGDISIGTKSTKVKLKLFGMNPDQFRDPNGHSVRVYLGGGKGFGKAKLNLLKPSSRDFNSDIVGNIIYKKLYNGLSINQEPIDLIFNKMNYGVYLYEDFFDKYFIEKNSFRESIIFESIKDSIHFNYIPKSIEFQSKSETISSFINNDSTDSLLDLIDHKKMIGFLSICYLFNENHPLREINLHWYYNPVTNKLEPTIRETNIVKIENIVEYDYFKNFKTNFFESNYIINKWIHSIGKEKFINELYQNIFYINSDIQKILEAPEYLIFKKKLLGLKKEFAIKENALISNLNLLGNNKIRNLIGIPTEEININKDTIIKNDLIIKKGEKLIINEGTHIFLDNNADIIVYGEIQINGTIQNKIIIESFKNSNSSIYIQSDKEAIIKNTSFINLSALNRGLWSTPSAITIYETNISFINCSFQSNQSGDDMINLFRCRKVGFKNCIFKNVLSDAIDSDFSNIIIKNSTFSNIGNDGVDGSGSNILVDNSYFDNVQDKAISAGEKSNFELKQNIISNSELAIVCKDGSVISSTRDSLVNNKLDIVAFIKKNEYDFPVINIHNTKFSKYLVEKDVRVNGVNIPLKRVKKVKDKLYGKEYGKSSK